jgi:peptidyl-prolyl cis-trans isomerase D
VPTDAALQPPDSEIQAYYDSHQSEYTQPARATVRLASLRLEPSAEDEADVKQILADIRKEIVGHTTTFADAATTWSEDPSAKDGGDLGFFDRQRMVAAFADVAFALPIGEVSEPVRTQFGLHLITVTDEKLSTPAKRGEKPTRSEVRASHILLNVRPSQSTLVSLRERADAALQDASTSGIEAAAQRHGLQFATTPAFQESFNIPGVANSMSGARFAFANPPGTLSPVYQTDESVYFFEVAERLPEGTRTLDEVRTLVIGSLQREARAQKAAQALAPAWTRIQGGAGFEQAAKEFGLTYGKADSFSYRQNITDVGFATSFAKASLELTPGQMLQDVRTQRGAYIVKLLWKTPFDEELFKQKRAEIAQSLLFNRQRQILDAWTTDLKAKAKIVDRRSADML